VTYDPHDTAAIPVGTTVIAADGSVLGTVREVHPHYLLAGEEGQHRDLEIPVHAIREFANGRLHVSINREAATSVDDVETAHRLTESDDDAS
jgi:hypothetical protein